MFYSQGFQRFQATQQPMNTKSCSTATFAFQIKIELNRISSIQRIKPTIYIYSIFHTIFPLPGINCTLSPKCGIGGDKSDRDTQNFEHKHTAKKIACGGNTEGHKSYTYIVHQARVMSLVEFLTLDAP